MPWTATDIPDQSGRTYVITGANSGLGAVTARALGARGAEVILACRNTAKAEPVAADIGERAQIRKLDLADLESVRAFAAETGPTDVLINNAGIMAVPKRRTADGFEMQIGTNHLGHFALTNLMLPRIRERVVTLSSGAHRARTANPSWVSNAESKSASASVLASLSAFSNRVRSTGFSQQPCT